MGIDRKLMASSTGMMLLKLLEQEDMYGYQMIEGAENSRKKMKSGVAA